MFSGKMRKNKTHRYFFSCLSAGVSLQCRWQDAQFPPQPPCQPPFWQINPIASASSTKITMTTITLAIPIASAYYYTTKRRGRQVYILRAAVHTTHSRKEATIYGKYRCYLRCVQLRASRGRQQVQSGADPRYRALRALQPDPAQPAFLQQLRGKVTPRSSKTKPGGTHFQGAARFLLARGNLRGLSRIFCENCAEKPKVCTKGCTT